MGKRSLCYLYIYMDVTDEVGWVCMQGMLVVACILYLVKFPPLVPIASSYMSPLCLCVSCGRNGTASQEIIINNQPPRQVLIIDKKKRYSSTRSNIDAQKQQAITQRKKKKKERNGKKEKGKNKAMRIQRG